MELKNRILERKTLLVISLFFVTTLCVYAPYEMYLTNKDEFWFDFHMFWWIPLVVAISLIFIIMLLGILFKERLLLIYETIIFAMSICFYIQGNFLNLKIGVMNGSEVDWKQYDKHFLIDISILCAILIVLIVSVLVKHFISEKAIMFVSLFFSAIQMITLLVLLIPVIINENNGTGKTLQVISDKGLHEMGTESNIVVFILDMFDDEYFKEILELEPEIKDELDGFTYFSNFTGSYNTTSYSMAHLSTGKYCYNENELRSWLAEISVDRQYWDELIDDGYQPYIYSTVSTCFSPRFVGMSKNYIEAQLKINNKFGFVCDFFRLVSLKYFPDIFKPYLWMDGSEFDKYRTIDSEYNLWSGENIEFKKSIQIKGISTGEDQKQIKFIHINGSHYPYTINENAESVEPDSVSGIQCAQGVLQIVREYLNELKKSGCYDNTSIIITADHGYYWDGVLTSPVFVAKPFNTTGELTITNVPACQGDFAPTVLGLAGLNKDHKYGVSAFDIEKDSQRNRFFYQYYLQEHSSVGELYRLIEYSIGPESNDPSGYMLTDVEYTIKGEKIKHSEYCKTCKEGADDDRVKYIPPSKMDSSNKIENYDPPRLVHQRDRNYPE